jgi:molybdopterin converting factor small subunit
MKIRVQFFAQLRDAIGTSKLDVKLKEGASVNDLLAALYEQMPSLQKWGKTILVGAGVEFVGRDYLLQPNEEISIMPPLQGG